MLKLELQKLFIKPYFICSFAVLSLWTFILYNTFIWTPARILQKSLDFWGKLGSIALCFIILMIVTRLFIMDVNENTEDVFNAAKFGKGKLFKIRLKAGIIFIFITVLLFTWMNLIISMYFNRISQDLTIPLSISVPSYYLLQVLSVIIGAISFIICASCICNGFKSQSITVIICGLLFGISYITRSASVNKFSIHWFLERGFFSYMMRGKILADSLWEMAFWIFWHCMISCIAIIAGKKVQLRRNEL